MEPARRTGVLLAPFGVKVVLQTAQVHHHAEKISETELLAHKIGVLAEVGLNDRLEPRNILLGGLMLILDIGSPAD